MSTTDGQDGSARVITRRRAIEAASQMFVLEARLDMRELAGRLAVGRATLYRVVGSRSALLGEVLASLAEGTLRAAANAVRAEGGGVGLERVIEVGVRFRNLAVGFAPLRTFARDEPLATATAMFTPGPVHDRLVAAWRGILLEAAGPDERGLPLPADDLAEIVFRLGGSMLYADLLADPPPDVDLTSVVLRPLLSARGTT